MTRIVKVLAFLMCSVLLLPIMVSPRWLSVDPAHAKYPSWAPYVYVRDNPMKLIDPTGMWDDPANAVLFVNAAMVDKSRPYSHDPRKGVDCSRLVNNALARVDAQGVGTAVFDKMGSPLNSTEHGEIQAGTLLSNATKDKPSEAGLQVIEYKHDEVKAGDLLATNGHVEIVTAVTKNGVSTVGASNSQKSVVPRPNVRPDQPGAQSPWGKEIPQIVRITEKKKED